MCFNIIFSHIRLLSSEVESELSKLFSKGGKWKNQAKQSGNSMKFQMLVEDISEGVLVSSIYFFHSKNISLRVELNLGVFLVDFLGYHFQQCYLLLLTIKRILINS